MEENHFSSSDVKNLNKTVGRVFTNFDPVHGSETLFKSRRHEVFIFSKSKKNETYYFNRIFAEWESYSYQGDAFLTLFLLIFSRLRSHLPFKFGRNDNYARE